MSLPSEYLPAPDEADLAGSNGESFSPMTAELKPFNIWRPSQFIDWTELPGSHILQPAYLTRGELTTMIGQGGLGKSRLALFQAICQILGRPWCGLEVYGQPQTWLFLGDENSIARFKEDLGRMFSVLNPTEIARVDEFLRLPAIQDLDDSDLCLRDPFVQARMSLTVKKENPGVVVVDPLANIAPGDIAKPGEMKEAVRLLLGLIRKAAPKAALELLHHARTGRTNIAQGVGYNAANFASGGKALFASSRCQMNLMPGNSEDETRLVLSCAKSNNCEKFETRGIVFDPETFTYSVDPEFDVDAWLADVEGRPWGGKSLCTVAEVTSAVRNGYSTTKELVEHLMEACATPKRTVERVIQKAAENEAIKQIKRGKFMLGRNSAKYLRITT
jgi:hypothetical protein